MMMLKSIFDSRLFWLTLPNDVPYNILVYYYFVKKTKFGNAKIIKREKNYGK